MNLTENKFQVLSVNISTDKGKSKDPREEIDVIKIGIVGDSHAGIGLKQISLLGVESIERFSREMGRAFRPGEFAENITTEGLDFSKISILDKIRIGDVLLEITAKGKNCHGETCEIFKTTGKCVMPKEGLFTRVISGGKISRGDEGEYIKRSLKALFVYLPNQVNEDAQKFNSKLASIFKEYLNKNNWEHEIKESVFLIDGGRLENLLISSKNIFNVIFIFGGSSISPGDIVPELLSRMQVKNIPSALDLIRSKAGAKDPKILYDRSSVSILGSTLIYALPDDAIASIFYLSEILRSIETAIYTIKNI